METDTLPGESYGPNVSCGIRSDEADNELLSGNQYSGFPADDEERED